MHYGKSLWSSPLFQGEPAATSQLVPRPTVNKPAAELTSELSDRWDQEPSNRWTTSCCSSRPAYVLYNKLHPVTRSNTQKFPGRPLPLSPTSMLLLSWPVHWKLSSKLTHRGPLWMSRNLFARGVRGLLASLGWVSVVILSGIKGVRGVLLLIPPVIKQGRDGTRWSVFMSDQKWQG